MFAGNGTGRIYSTRKSSKNEDKNATENHNGQRDKANETEMLKML